ncbi:MAG: DUF4406 domain-containing protein [Betaproteobacteria bacterium]|nr:DUF4406 domain-containing protein [Betaproteobacteria bacterium]
MKRVYVSGPMTGLPELNFPVFYAEARRLRELGYTVINPAELNKNETRRAQCMRRDIRALTLCDAVQLLPGWRASKGAALELAVAKELGMQVFDHYNPIMEACNA